MAYRAVNWEWVQRAENAVFGVEWEWSSVNFPAPSHIIDATLKMLGFHTGFGEPIGAGWPRVPESERAVPTVTAEAPEITFTAPFISPANLHKPAEFTVRLAKIGPQEKPPVVELMLGKGSLGVQRIVMEREGDVYRATAVPLPKQPEPRLVRITASFPIGDVIGTAENSAINIAGRTLKLGEIKQVDRPTGRTTLVDGSVLDALPESMKAVAIDLGGVTTAVNLDKAGHVDIAPLPPLPEKIDWHITVSSGRKVLAETSGVLPVGDATAPGKPLTFGPPAPPPPHVEHVVPWYRSELVLAIAVSAERLLIGFAISVIVGALLGLLMWRFEEFDKFIGPVFLGLQTLPSVCWVPMAVMVFGLSEHGVMFVLVMGSFSAAALSLRDGLRTIPPLYPRAGLMLGAKNWRLYRYVLLPASLPALAGSLRTGFSFAWRSLMGAELIFAVADHGLGFLLDNARNLGTIADVVALMIAMVVIGILADRWIFATLQRRVQARFGLK